MLKFQILILIVFLSFNLKSQIVEWVNPAVGNNYDFVNFTDIETDKFGDLYVTGYFDEELIYNGKSETSHKKMSHNFFVAKIDPQGNIIWRRDAGYHYSGPFGVDVEVDSSGNIYAVGAFRDSIYFEGGFSMRSRKYGQSVGSFFIAKYSNQGNLLSAVEHDSARTFDVSDFYEDESGAKLQIINQTQFEFYGVDRISKYDKNLNHLSENKFNNNIKSFFNDGSNMYSVKEGDTLLSKLNSALMPVWSKTTNRWYSIPTVEFDPQGNSYAMGLFNSTLTVDTNTINSNGFREGYYLIKSNDAGTTQWIKCISIPGNASGHFSTRTVHFINDSLLIIQGASQDSFYYDGLQEKDVGMFIIGVNPSNGSPRWGIFDHGSSVQHPRAMASYEKSLYSSGGFNHNMDLQGHKDSGWAYIAKINLGDNLIAGKVFYDFNKDGVFNSGDLYARDHLISLNFPTATVKTNSKGDYLLYVGQGSFSFSPSVVPNYYTSVPVSHSAFFASTSLSDTNNHFALQPAASINDLVIHLTPITPARPGFNLGYTLTYENVGTTVLNGHIRLNNDIKLTYLNSTRSVDSTLTNALSWNFTALSPFQSGSFNIFFKLDSTASLGDTVWMNTVIYPVSGDSTAWNNFDTTYQIIVGSYDPNDKTVYPENDLNTNIYASGKKTLEYQIRFQNTGTDTAFTVRIYDTLSALYDVSSFEMISASHPYELEIKNNNILVWTFRDILLVDSGTNEPLSHGFVRFSIRTSSGIKHGDLLKNKAYIYFDFNQAIETNEAVNEISDWAQIKKSDKISGIQIYPNPAHSEFIIELESDVKPVGIFDIMGRDVTNQFNITPEGKYYLVKKSKDISGWYVVLFSSGESLESRKLILLK